jgi:NAD(P)H-hydrate epimerase
MSSSTARIVTTELLKTLPLVEHGDDASKADRGKLLIVAGSSRLPGTAILAARAALRVGCGTVRVAAPASVATLIGIVVPELMVVPLPETSSGTPSLESLTMLEEQYGSCDAAVVGPGMGDHEETNLLARRLVEEMPLPLVVDAQALLALAPMAPGRRLGAPSSRILTPHPGEMAALSALSVDAIEADREGVASRFAREWGTTLLLKGRETLIVSPPGRDAGAGDSYRNTAGTPGLGTAGSGDVLAGVIGGLLAQGNVPPAAAVWGVHLHSIAGEAAAGDEGDDGMIAGDIVDHLPRALRALRLAP